MRMDYEKPVLVEYDSLQDLTAGSRPSDDRLPGTEGW